MKILSVPSTIVAGVLILFSPIAGSNQADDTTITINGYTPGVTPFIAYVNLTASDTTVLKSIQFSIDRKPGSFSCYNCRPSSISKKNAGSSILIVNKCRHFFRGNH